MELEFIILSHQTYLFVLPSFVRPELAKIPLFSLAMMLYCYIVRHPRYVHIYIICIARIYRP